MSVNQRIATALAALIGGVLAIWGIELPGIVDQAIVAVIGLLVGWVLPTPKQKVN